MAPEIVVNMDLPLAEVALRSGLLGAEHIIEADRDRFLKESFCFKIDGKRLEKLIWKKSAAMKVIWTLLLAMENKRSYSKNKKRFYDKI